MNMNQGILTPLIPFLGACIYGDAEKFYAGLDHSGRQELETQAKLFGMSPWLYRYLSNVLPDGVRSECQRVFQMCQAESMRAILELDRLCDVLRNNGLRFALIKGADLAYRLYPEAALRRYGDWNVLFHPDDCGRALEVLSKDGWEIPIQYTDNHEAVMKTSAHHFSLHIRGGYKVEPHFTLPNFANIDPHEFWEYTIEQPGGGQYVLSPEFNLLMLTRHAASKSYFHVSIPKLLTDAAMVMRKEKIDFMKLRSMTDKWHLPYSGNLLAAFPEFFPADVIADFHADPEDTLQFRRVFEERAMLREPQSVSLVLNRFHAQGNTFLGLWKYVRNCTPDKMRILYHLPKHGAWGRVALAYVSYFWTRSWRVACSFARHDTALRDYCLMVAALESQSPQETKCMLK
jgi:hypothetical protein